MYSGDYPVFCLGSSELIIKAETAALPDEVMVGSSFLDRVEDDEVEANPLPTVENGTASDDLDVADIVILPQQTPPLPSPTNQVEDVAYEISNEATALDTRYTGLSSSTIYLPHKFLFVYL